MGTQSIRARTPRNSSLFAATLLLAFSAPLLQGCGDSGNVFAFASKKSDKDKGRSALARGDYDTAISELENSLRNNPNDPAARSMLANAYLKKSGLDELKIASQISSSQGNGDFGALMSAMPPGTPENRDRMEKAVEVLSGIPPEQRTEQQNYQLAVAQASLAVTVVKQTTGGSEPKEMSNEEIDAISDDDAETMYESMTGAATSLNGAGSAGQEAGAAPVNNVAGELSVQEGATPAEKMRNFLKGKN